MVGLEEGGVFDYDSMPDWMKTTREVAPDYRLPLCAPAPGFIPVAEGLPPPPGMWHPLGQMPPGLACGMSGMDYPSHVMQQYPPGLYPWPHVQPGHFVTSGG